MPPRARRTDANHAEILRAAGELGFHVWDCHALPGPFDAVLGLRGVNIGIEIKAAKGRETRTQREKWSAWRGQRAIVRSIDDLITLYKGLQNEHPHRIVRPRPCAEF